METRPELLLLQKTMVVIEGVARELEPGINVWSLAKPLVAGWVAENLGPQAKAKRMLSEAQVGMRDWLQLPGEIRAALQRHEDEAASSEEVPLWRDLIGLVLLAGGAVGLGMMWQQEQMLQGIGAVLVMFLGLAMALTLRR